MRVMNLPGWPPEASGTFARGGTFPMTPDQVFIERVVHTTPDVLTFACSFNDGKAAQHPLYHWRLLGDKTQKIEKILHDNKGNTLLSIGTIEIPEDDDE
jgi:hypothetical protein